MHNSQDTQHTQPSSGSRRIVQIEFVVIFVLFITICYVYFVKVTHQGQVATETPKTATTDTSTPERNGIDNSDSVLTSEEQYTLLSELGSSSSSSLSTVEKLEVLNTLGQATTAQVLSGEQKLEIIQNL